MQEEFVSHFKNMVEASYKGLETVEYTTWYCLDYRLMYEGSYMYHVKIYAVLHPG